MKEAIILLLGFREPGEVPTGYKIPYLEQGEIDDVLHYLFRQTNRVDGTEYISTHNIKVRSTSVGDIFIVEGRHFIVDNIGFIEVNRENSAKWEHLDSRDQSLGWRWNFKNGGLECIGKI